MALRRASKWSFYWRIWLETTLCAYVVGNVLQAILHTPERRDLIGRSTLSLVVLAIFVGPLFETLVFQCLPLELGRALRMRPWAQFFVSIVPFAIGHWFAGIPTVVAAGVVGGFFFAFTYVRWKRESLFVAVAMTFLLHAAFNSVGVLGMLLFGR